MKLSPGFIFQKPSEVTGKNFQQGPSILKLSLSMDNDVPYRRLLVPKKNVAELKLKLKRKKRRKKKEEIELWVKLKNRIAGG